MTQPKKIIRKRTPVELIAACMANEGVKPREGMKRSEWLNRHYDVKVDHRLNVYIATRR